MTTSAKQIINVSVPASDAQGLSGDGITTQRHDDSPFSIKVAGVPDNNDEGGIVHFGIYEWNFSVNDIETFLGVSTLKSVKLEMYYQNADSPRSIEDLGIFILGSSLSTSDAALYSACLAALGDIAATVYPSGNQKTKVQYTFTSLISDVQSAVKSQSKLTVLLKPTDQSIGGEKPKEGQILIGGSTLHRGVENPWEEAGSGEISDPPRLIMEWESDAGDHPQHLMKYTTEASPSSNQNTPSASLGGYMAPNLVHTRVQLAEDINNTQTTIPIQSGSSLPTSGNLVLVGSEIVSYTGTNSSENEITGVTRAVVPPSSYSAITQPYPSFVHYLDVDALFDTKPTSSLVQYRCVAIQQQSVVTSTPWQTTFPKILLTQNPNTDVVIDIGVEVPEWDVHNGTLATSVSGDNEITSTTATVGTALGVTNYEDGFFNGGHLVLDPDGDSVGPLNYIIDSYEFNAGVATFFLEDDLPSTTIAAGTAFRINPAPSQVIANETTSPNNNNGRFSGFLGAGGTGNIVLEEHSNVIFDYDVFYIWIKRTLKNNKKSSSDSGAIITILAERLQ